MDEIDRAIRHGDLDKDRSLKLGAHHIQSFPKVVADDGWQYSIEEGYSRLDWDKMLAKARAEAAGGLTVGDLGYEVIEDWTPGLPLEEIDFIDHVNQLVGVIKTMENSRRPLYMNPADHEAHVDEQMERLARSYGVRFVCDDAVPEGKAFMIPELEDEDE